MKMLLLLRHAKASRDDTDLPDHDRPLKGRGKEDAKSLGRRLHEAGIVPTLIVSSTALRAKKTASKVAKQLAYTRAIELSDRLYLSSPDDHCAVIRSLPDAEDRVMLVGHNPGISQVLNQFTRAETELATCELAQLELAIERWADLAKGSRAELTRIWQPTESH